MVDVQKDVPAKTEDEVETHDYWVLDHSSHYEFRVVVASVSVSDSVAVYGVVVASDEAAQASLLVVGLDVLVGDQAFVLAAGCKEVDSVVDLLWDVEIPADDLVLV